MQQTIAELKRFSVFNRRGERLGAIEVPKSRAALDAYIEAVRPQLRDDHRTREQVADFERCNGDDRYRCVAQHVPENHSTER